MVESVKEYRHFSYCEDSATFLLDLNLGIRVLRRDAKLGRVFEKRRWERGQFS